MIRQRGLEETYIGTTVSEVASYGSGCDWEKDREGWRVEDSTWERKVWEDSETVGGHDCGLVVLIVIGKVVW